MNIMESYLLLGLLVVVVSVACFLCNGKYGIVSSISIATGLIVMLVAGQGVQLRVATEGAVVYLDTAMWVLCGMAFAHILYKNGTFSFLFQKIMSKKRSNFVQMLLLVLFIALPGMLTGTVMASVCTTGYLAGRYLLDHGLEKVKAVEVVAMSALLGMILPPLCLPAMATVVARRGIYPGSFEGYFVPMLCIGLILTLLYVATASGRIVGEVEADTTTETKGSVICLLPLLVVALLLLSHNFLYAVMPFVGYPLIYTVGFILAIFFGCEKVNPLTVAADAMIIVAVELALVMAMACAIEVYAFAGVSGTISTQIALIGVDTALVTLGLAVLAVVLGMFVGLPATYTVIALAIYVGTSYSGQMNMVGLGLCAILAFALARKTNIVSLVAEQLEVTDVCFGQIIKSNLLVIIALALIAVFMILSGGSLMFLMV